MSERVQAYRCTGPEGFGGEVELSRARGFQLAASVPAAFAQREAGNVGGAWPFRLFEVSVADEHRLPAKGDGGAIHARSFRVEREVGLEELLGPRAGEIARLLEELPRYPWLRPSGRRDTEERIGPLFTEHNVALLAYGPTPRTPIVVMNDWLPARETCEVIDKILPSTIAAVGAVSPALGERSARRPACTAFWAAAFAAFDGAWRGGWDVASSAITAGWDDIHATVKMLGPRYSPEVITLMQQDAAEGTAAAMRGARELSWKAARRIAEQVLTFTSPELEAPSVIYREAEVAGLVAFRASVLQRAHKGSRRFRDKHPADGVVSDYLIHTSEIVFRLALGAAYVAGWHTAYLAQNPDLPNPWKPLLEVWALGAWPIGRCDGVPHVFLPRPRS